MSIFIQLDPNDVENMLELTAGHYVYNSEHNDLYNVQTGSLVYVNRKPLHLEDNWMQYFVISAATKVAIYDTDQSVQQLQYTGNTLVLYNYNNKKSQRVNYTLKEFSPPVYIVIEQLSGTICKKHSNKFEKVFIDSSKHNFKTLDEPLIKPFSTPFIHADTKTIVATVVLIIMCIALFTTLFIISYKQALPLSINDSLLQATK